MTKELKQPVLDLLKQARDFSLREQGKALTSEVINEADAKEWQRIASQVQMVIQQISPPEIRRALPARVQGGLPAQVEQPQQP